MFIPGAQILRIDKHYDVPQEVPELNVNYHRNLMEQACPLFCTCHTDTS